MSRLKVFTVYDSKADAYLSPFFMRSKGEALRAFQDTCNDPKTQFNKHPGDFTLFEIGEYDEEKGRLMPREANVNLGCAIEFKMEEPEQ